MWFPPIKEDDYIGYGNVDEVQEEPFGELMVYDIVMSVDQTIKQWLSLLLSSTCKFVYRKGG